MFVRNVIKSETAIEIDVDMNVDSKDDVAEYFQLLERVAGPFLNEHPHFRTTATWKDGNYRFLVNED